MTILSTTKPPSRTDKQHRLFSDNEARRLHHITNDMQRSAAEKIGGFMESATATPTPEPPDPSEESRCKVIPFDKVG